MGSSGDYDYYLYSRVVPGYDIETLSDTYTFKVKAQRRGTDTVAVLTFIADAYEPEMIVEIRGQVFKNGIRIYDEKGDNVILLEENSIMWYINKKAYEIYWKQIEN